MMSSTRIPTATRRVAAALTIALAVTGACGDKSKHATDGDTGAAAPATVKDMSATPQAGDSTAGVSNPTGQPAMAGDTMGARAKDSTPGTKGGSPVGGSGAAGGTTKRP